MTGEYNSSVYSCKDAGPFNIQIVSGWHCPRFDKGDIKVTFTITFELLVNVIVSDSWESIF